MEEEKAALAARLTEEKTTMERERATLASKMAEEKAALATRLDREAAAHEMEKAKLAAKMAEERALLTAQVRPTHHNITSFYGPSCANNGEDALNTPEAIMSVCISLVICRH